MYMIEDESVYSVPIREQLSEFLSWPWYAFFLLLLVDVAFMVFSNGFLDAVLGVFRGILFVGVSLIISYVTYAHLIARFEINLYLQKSFFTRVGVSLAFALVVTMCTGVNIFLIASLTPYMGLLVFWLIVSKVIMSTMDDHELKGDVMIIKNVRKAELGLHIPMSINMDLSNGSGLNQLTPKSLPEYLVRMIYTGIESSERDNDSNTLIIESDLISKRCLKIISDEIRGVPGWYMDQSRIYAGPRALFRWTVLKFVFFHRRKYRPLVRVTIRRLQVDEVRTELPACD